jgi:hypothetical protein
MIVDKLLHAVFQGRIAAARLFDKPLPLVNRRDFDGRGQNAFKRGDFCFDCRCSFEGRP